MDGPMKIQGDWVKQQPPYPKKLFFYFGKFKTYCIYVRDICWFEYNKQHNANIKGNNTLIEGNVFPFMLTLTWT